MFEVLDRRARLTGSQIKMLSAAIIDDALEFFDYFLIGFVVAFLIGFWKLTFGQSAILLMSSGICVIIGAYVCGWIADRIGRRMAFVGMLLNSGNYLKPDVPRTQIQTALVYLCTWLLMAGVVYYFIGIESRGKAIEQIGRELTAGADLTAMASVWDAEEGRAR